jgi:ATP-binding cassette subfamily F protein 3
MAEIGLALAEVQASLGDTELYAEARKQELADLLKREGELKNRAEQLDELWLEQQQTL